MSPRLAPLAALAALTLAFATACPDPGEDAPDAGEGPAARDAGSSGDAGGKADASAGADAGERPDAGKAVESCDDLPGEDCFANRDCAAAERCQGYGSGDGEFSCCTKGSRGTKAVGEECTAHEQCDFGRCIARDDGKRFCSGECTYDWECQGLMACSDVFHWCYPLDSGEKPTDCGQVNLDQCFENDNCEANERCESLGAIEDEVLCCTVGPRGTGKVGATCDSGLDCAYGRCVGGLCSAYCDFDVDPCPPQTMECNLIRFRCEPLP